MSLSSNLNALVDAARNGNLEEINLLLEDIQVAQGATFNDNAALCAAAENGHLVVVRRLLEIHAVVEHAADLHNRILRLTSENGHHLVVDRLLEIPAVIDQATVMFNDALRVAVQRGHIEVVERLLQIPDVVDRAAAYSNEMLGYATRNGHLAVVNRLLQIPAVVEELANDSRGIMEEARDHPEIAARLMQIPAVAVAVALAVEENAGFDSGLEEELLEEQLSKEKKSKAKAVSEEELRIQKIIYPYFAQIKSAIRKGDVETLIKNLSEVKEERLEKYLADDDNSILLYAISDAPEDKVETIVEKLLESLVIRQAEGTEGRPTYRAAQHAARKKGLEKLAQQIAKVVSEIEMSSAREGSMRALNPARAKLKEILTKKYGNRVSDVKTRQNIIEEIKQYIAKKYSDAPAKVRKLGQEQTLPLERLKRELTEEELAAYYQHEIHTAHRYFLNPNPWMSPNAPHIAGDPSAGTGNAIIQEQDEEFFALLWLAIQDKDLPVPHMEGAREEAITQARQDYIDTFIKEFAELNRAHNRDSLKDDGEGDKPTCQLGVTNRMAGFLELRMAIPILSLEQIKTRFETEIINKVIENLDRATIDEFSAILVKMVGGDKLNKEEIDFISRLNFNDSKRLSAFERECNTLFAEEDNPEPLSKKGQGITWTGVGGNQKFDTYNELIKFISEDPLRTVEIYLEKLYNTVNKKKEEMEKIKIPTSKPAGQV